MLVQTKKWYSSKLLWLGVVQVIGGAAELIVEVIEAPEAAIAAVVSGIATIVLRAVTERPITFTDIERKEVKD